MKTYKTTSFDLTVGVLLYCRFARQWACVDEFCGADILADTGNNTIEIEIKITKTDLINGEKRKHRKHEAYKAATLWRIRPNKFYFCVPEQLVDSTVKWIAVLNPDYGIIAFNTESFENDVDTNRVSWWGSNFYIRIAKSAKQLHKDYVPFGKPMIRRMSAKIAILSKCQFERNIAARMRYENDTR